MMRAVALLLLCLAAAAVCQTLNNNGNPTGEIGSPAFDEIVVHSTLNVRGKSAARGAKALSTAENKPKTLALLNTNTTTQTASVSSDTSGAVLTLKRPKRVPRRNNIGSGFIGAPGPGGNYGGGPGGGYGGGFGGNFNSFPSSSSAQASSNAFNQNTPFGSFGGSASQTATQSQGFGPNGPQAAAGQSASQTYRLPNGNTIDVAFSSGYSTGGKGGPSFTGAHSVTVTRPNGQKYQVAGRR